ncbi:D-Tyr tRNAtyr deacylase-like domain-containing protein [Phakopsora pachyrhizi]|uniref:D-aminoacyl-tRNA deacylase n=1 Tax=Phakopsora pachyrhizi TaxID=170000 RepID=A0AAV0APN0_PHAPC|nr:D-Tyr tRNAtyr deacylase-like domain-containing protein [Phakopsora pachyrhizi]
MRVVIQRVLSASVSVDGNKISEIGRGLCILVGIGTDDSNQDLDYILSKVLSIRLFSDSNPPSQSTQAEELIRTEPTQKKHWSRNVKDIEGEILCVSQFTLMAKTKKGSKPDFHNAMGSESSRKFYEEFLSKMRASYNQDRIKDGEFGAMMDVQIVNEGPVTIVIDSKDR